MYIHDAIYDIEELMQENLHVHSLYSHCAKLDRTLRVILDEAEEAKLRTVAIVDHYNNDDTEVDFGHHVQTLRQELAEKETPVRMLIGAELSAYGVGKWLESEALRTQLDYRLYACNHYHLDYWEHPDDKSPEGYAKHMAEVASAVIRSGHADCLAHPFNPGYIKTEVDKEKICNAMTETRLGDVFELAKQYETAIELNSPTKELYGLQRRIFNVGREVGVVFNYGTDAHRAGSVATMQHFQEVKKVLIG